MRFINKCRNDSYIQINMIFAGIIILMIIYFGIFSSEGISHPIPSLFSIKVPSTGLSRSFSEIVRFDFNSANQLNPYGIRLFVFFIAQLGLRVILTILLLYNRYVKKVILFVDLLISVLLFLPTFGTYLFESLNL